MSDKKKKSCVKHIHLVTDDGLFDQTVFYTVKFLYFLSFYSSSMMANLSILKSTRIEDNYYDATWLLQ